MESNESITLLFYVSQLLLLVVSITVGLRMLWLTRRTRCLPELLLGANFLLGAGLGFMLLVSGVIRIVQPDADVVFAERLVMAGWLCIGIGFSANVFFNYHVYRPTVTWAKILGGAIVFFFWAGFLGRGLRGDFAEVNQFDGAWYLVHCLPIVINSVWGAIEPILYYGALRKRQRLGLADPIMTNRFFVWSGASLCGFAMVILGNSPAFYDLMDPAVLPLVSTLTLISMAFAGIVAASLYGLTFFPPKRYLHWINDRAVAQGAPTPS